MDAEEERLFKLIQRKKQFLEQNPGHRMEAAIKAEIHIIQGYVSKQEEHQLEAQQIIYNSRKEITHLKNKCWTLEAICLLHGIDDLAMWLAKGFRLVLSELKEDIADGYTRIPSKQQHIYEQQKERN